MQCKAIYHNNKSYGICGCKLEAGHKGNHVCYMRTCDNTWSDTDEHAINDTPRQPFPGEIDKAMLTGQMEQLQQRIEELEAEKAEQESVLLGVGRPILCRNQKQHPRDSNLDCMYCIIERLEQQLAAAREAVKNVPMRRGGELFHTFMDRLEEWRRQTLSAMKGE